MIDGEPPDCVGERGGTGRVSGNERAGKRTRKLGTL